MPMPPMPSFRGGGGGLTSTPPVEGPNSFGSSNRDPLDLPSSRGGRGGGGGAERGGAMERKGRGRRKGDRDRETENEIKEEEEEEEEAPARVPRAMGLGPVPPRPASLWSDGVTSRPGSGPAGRSNSSV